MFLTAKKIPSVSHHTKSNKICNELQQKSPMQFGYRTNSNIERFCEFDAWTNRIITNKIERTWFKQDLKFQFLRFGNWKIKSQCKF